LGGKNSKLSVRPAASRSPIFSPPEGAEVMGQLLDDIDV
jgi:hypothetical protein